MPTLFFKYHQLWWRQISLKKRWVSGLCLASCSLPSSQPQKLLLCKWWLVPKWVCLFHARGWTQDVLNLSKRIPASEYLHQNLDVCHHKTTALMIKTRKKRKRKNQNKTQAVQWKKSFYWCLSTSLKFREVSNWCIYLWWKWFWIAELTYPQRWNTTNYKCGPFKLTPVVWSVDQNNLFSFHTSSKNSIMWPSVSLSLLSLIPLVCQFMYSCSHFAPRPLWWWECREMLWRGGRLHLSKSNVQKNQRKWINK